MRKFLERAHEIAGEIIELRRQLHACPEIGNNLPETTGIVKSYLTSIGCEFREICSGSIVADIYGGKPGKTILLRADMDALPMREESGLSFAAQGNAAHTCGHDMHTAMLLGTAKLLIERRSELFGAVRLVFQPAEETMTGAAAMIEAGLFTEKKIDAAIGMHVIPDRPEGKYFLPCGYIMASSDAFSITVKGKGGHGAMPHKCIDPIAAAVQIYLSAQSLTSRECAPDGKSILTIGSFHAGAAGNTIPDSAIMQGTTRNSTPEARDFIISRLEECVHDISSAHRTEGIMDLLASVPPLYNDPAISVQMASIIRELLGEGAVDETPEFRSVSEDFALIAQTVPSVYIRLGAGINGDEPQYAVHNPKVKFSEDVLPKGSAMMCACAAKWLAGNT